MRGRVSVLFSVAAYLIVLCNLLKTSIYAPMVISKLFYIILLTKCLKSGILVSSNERGECEMHNKKNFEVRATKNGQTATFYVVSYVYDGIASDIASMYEQDGYSDVTVRIA